MNYYVVKHTQEAGGNTQVIRAHTDLKAATKDYHREIAETLEYDIDVLGVMLIDEYNKVLDSYRYEKPSEEPIEP